MVGRRLPLLRTAIGLTYLAYCPEAERAQLLAMLAERKGEEYALARDTEQITLELERVRKQGYGENFKRWAQEEKFAAIAVPVRIGSQLLGCLNLVYLANAMRTEQAAQKYLPALQQTAQAIEKAVFEMRAQQLRA